MMFKGKDIPLLNPVIRHYAINAYEVSEGIAPPFLTLVTDGGEWSGHHGEEKNLLSLQGF
jgi:hypothetical protein